MPKRISDDELCADLQEVANELGESPTVRQYGKHGTYNDSTLRNRFGSWSEALQAAGLDDTGAKRPIPTSQLIDELQTLAEEFGESPTSQQMDEHGPRWHSVYRDRFGSWNEALEAANLELNQQSVSAGASNDESPSTEPGDASRTGPISTDEILESLREVAQQLGQPPTRKQFNAEGICSDATVYKRFESWETALETAGLDPDVPRGAIDKSRTRISDATLIADIQRLADDSGEPPTLQEYREDGEYGAQTLYDRFGSWNNAVEAAGFEGRDPVSKVPEEKLIAEVERVAGDDGVPPTVTDMHRDGEYWVSTYQDRFGSWTETLQAAGFDATPRTLTSTEDHNREDLITTIRDVASELDERPTRAAVTSKGEYTIHAYRAEFGSWGEALEAAGFASTSQTPTDEHDRADLLDEVQRLAVALDKRPTRAAMASDGEYSIHAYETEFGSWRAALEAAGFDPPTSGQKVPEDELLAEIRRLADDLGEPPTAREMDANGQYASATYQNRFGTWSTAVEKALEAAEIDS